MATSQQLIRRTFAPSALVGHVYARKYGTDDVPFPIGNVLALTLEHTESVETQPNMTRLGGGVHAEKRRVTEAKVSMTLADLNATNWARASLGTVHGVEAGTVSAEEHTVKRGGLLKTAHMGIKEVVIYKGTAPSTATVTDEEHLNVDKGDLVVLAHSNVTNVTVRAGTSNATATVLTPAGNYTVEGGNAIQIAADAPGVTDGQGIWVSYQYPTAGTVVSGTGNYEVRAAGVYVLPEAVDLADDDVVFLAYEYDSYVQIEGLTTKAAELEFTFEGLNEADDGKPSIVELWRASQGVASSIPLLSESGFNNLPVSGTILEDPTKTGEGISKYYRVRKV